MGFLKTITLPVSGLVGSLEASGRKIEKIIDVNRLEKKLEEIMAMDHSEFTVEEKLKALLQQEKNLQEKVKFAGRNVTRQVWCIDTNSRMLKMAQNSQDLKSFYQKNKR